MGIYNVHERLLPASASDVGALLDTLAGGDDDRLWAHHDWPPMAFDRPLAVGAIGGHGPVRYTVAAYVPGTWVRFTFTRPRGFHGFHEFAVLPVDAERTVLRNTFAMNARGLTRVTWPLFWRPMHNACLEDALDRAELACTGGVTPARRPAYARLLYALARRTPVADRPRADRPRADCPRADRPRVRRRP